MIGLTALIAAQAVTAQALPPEEAYMTRAQLGKVPEECSYLEESLADGATQREVHAYVKCLVRDRPNMRRKELDHGVALYRELLQSQNSSPRSAPVLGGVEYHIVQTYGRLGDISAMMAEAESLTYFSEADPNFACAFFDRLAVNFSDPLGVKIGRGNVPEAGKALLDRFDLGACPRFVPDGKWAGWPGVELYEGWFGDQLVAMGEPSFQGENSLDGQQLRFRLLVLPTRRSAFSIRVDQSSQGDAVLHAALLDGSGGYAPGFLASQVKRTLSPETWAAMEFAIDQASLHGMSIQPPRERSDGRNVSCIHGTEGVFELLDEGGRAFAMRHGCDEKSAELAALIRMAFDLLPDDFASVGIEALIVPGYSGL